MESIIRDVLALDEAQRAALEGMLGRELQPTQQVIINVVEAGLPGVGVSQEAPRQSLEDWTRVYEGLDDDQIAEIDNVINQRADLTREVP